MENKVYLVGEIVVDFFIRHTVLESIQNIHSHMLTHTYTPTHIFMPVKFP